MSCLFCRIISGEIPSDRIYENEDMIIIRDIAPQAERHYLMIPKQHYTCLAELNEARALTLARCLLKLSELADSLGLIGGYRVVSNCGDDACQSVQHLHIHVLGGEKLSGQMA